MEPTSASGIDTANHPADGQQPAEGRTATRPMHQLATGAPADAEDSAPPQHWLSMAMDLWLQDGGDTPPGTTATAPH